MFCKIFCYYEINDLDEVYNILKKEKESFIVYTDNDIVNTFIRSKGIKSKTFAEVFPDFAKLSFDIYEKTKKQMIMYDEACKNIQFLGFKIEDGLRHSIMNETLMLEKIRYILQNKENTVFIFEKFSQTFFTILDLASHIGYETDKLMKISIIKNKKFYQLEPSANHSVFERENKIAKYRSYYNIYSKNISTSDSTFYNFLKISSKIFKLVFDLLSSKIYEIFSRDVKKQMLGKVDKKNSDYSSEYAFFLSSGREDLVDVYVSVINKFVNRKIKFRIFTIDPITSSLLLKKRIEFVDLFKEVYGFGNYLKKTEEGKRFDKQLSDVAKKNNLSILFTRKLNQNIKDIIYRSISTSIIFDHIFQKYKFKVIITMDVYMFGNVISSLAKKYHIPSVCIEPLIVDDNAISSILYKADKLCIYGNQGFQVLKNFGFQNNRIVITGNPKYDYINSLDEKKSKKILKEKYKVDVDKNIIALAMSRWHDGDEEWIPEFVKFCNKNKFMPVIKLHPRYKKNIDGSYNKIQTIKDRCKGLNYHLTFDIELKYILSAASLVISDNSNVCVEAILLEKPLITINFVKENLEKAQRYHEFGGAIYTENYNELEKLVTKILLSEEYVAKLRKERSRVIDMYNSYNDGMASNRIFELILQINTK